MDQTSQKQEIKVDGKGCFMNSSSVSIFLDIRALEASMWVWLSTIRVLSGRFFFFRDQELFVNKNLRIKFWDSSFFLMTANDLVSKFF